MKGDTIIQENLPEEDPAFRFLPWVLPGTHSCRGLFNHVTTSSVGEISALLFVKFIERIIYTLSCVWMEQ